MPTLQRASRFARLRALSVWRALAARRLRLSRALGCGILNAADGKRADDIGLKCRAQRLLAAAESDTAGDN